MPLPVSLHRLLYRIAHAVLSGWWAVRRPRLHGVKCVLCDTERVLLVRHTYGRRAWDLPGGKVEREELPLAAARREMAEELGLGPAEWRSLGEIDVRDHRRLDTLHLFAAEVGAVPLTLALAELERAEWFPRGRLPPDRGPFVDQILLRLGV